MSGNRTVQIDHGNAGARTTSTYDIANRITASVSPTQTVAYTHDAAGNMTQKDDGVNVSFYAYDGPSRVATAEVPAGIATMTYNAIGQRTQKVSTDSSTTNYLYDMAKLLQESDGNDDVIHTYTNSTGEYGDLLSEYDEVEDETSFGTFDAQWSANAWIDESQNITDQYKYKAFGITSQASPTPIADDGPRYFGGQQNYYADLELDLYILELVGTNYQ